MGSFFPLSHTKFSHWTARIKEQHMWYRQGSDMCNAIRPRLNREESWALTPLLRDTNVSKRGVMWRLGSHPC